MKDTTDSQHSRLSKEAARLSALVTAIAGGIALLVAVAIPLGFLIISFRYESALVSSSARHTADRISP